MDIRKIIFCLSAALLCGCAVKAPDVYKAGDLTLPAITAVNGDEKVIVSAENFAEQDPVRAVIYSEGKRYVYDEITEEEKQKYFERLKKQGCAEFSQNCRQSPVNKNGEFIEVTVEGNVVTVSLGRM